MMKTMFFQSFLMLALLSVLASNISANQAEQALTVSQKRLLVCDKNGAATGKSVDLPQDQRFDFLGNLQPRLERIVSIFKTSDTNPNQEFVFIPADRDSSFICAKRSGAVIGVRKKEPEGTKTEIVGLLKDQDNLGHAAVLWVMEPDEVPGCFVLRSKELNEYVALDSNALSDDTDLIFTRNKAEAVKLRFATEDEGEPLVYSQNLASQKPEDPPSPKSIVVGDYPSKTSEACVRERLVPYFAVIDPLLESWEARIKEHPVYRIREYEWWERKECQVWPASAKTTLTVLNKVERAQFSTRLDIIEKVSQKGSASLIAGGTVQGPQASLDANIAWEDEIMRFSTAILAGEVRRAEEEIKLELEFSAISVDTLRALWLKKIRVDIERLNPKNGSVSVIKYFPINKQQVSRETLDPNTRRLFSFPSSP